MGTGGVGGQVRHAERGDRGGRGAVEGGDVAFDQPDLVDVRERQILGCGQDLDGAGGDPAVAALNLGCGDRGLRPCQRVERGEEPGLVLLAGEYEPGAAFVQVARVRALWPGSGDVLLRPRPLRWSWC